MLCLLYNFINPPITPLIIQRYLFRGHDLKKREFISLEKIPKQVISYTLALEDPNFYKHMGFEWEMIRRARQHNKKAGKIRFGASTISNQVARTIFLTTHRNYFRKYLEVQVTIIMEVLLSKDRMLELYLNYVEWGKGIYGIESATRHYYGKSARNLNREQSMRMVSILSNPIKYTPFTYQNSRSARIRYENLRKAFIASGG
ncbi:MAG: transglycosylase domain-containing protein [Candidatus Cloacimonadaceae bacterium]|nr:transglycosylase domain-containing protein [Candidatus Cloacimonadaceae bacterium]